MGKHKKLHDQRIYERTCDHCGKKFTEGWSILDFNADACSDECALAIYQAHQQGVEEIKYDQMYDLAGWCEIIF